MESYRLRFVPDVRRGQEGDGDCCHLVTTRQTTKKGPHTSPGERAPFADNAKRAAYMHLKDVVDEAPAESSRWADIEASGKEPRSTGSEAQATLVARRSQGRRGVAAAGRARHLPERACAPMRSFVGVHVAAGGRDSQPLAARAQANSAGAGNNGLRRAVHHRARGRLAGLHRSEARSHENP